MPKYDKSLLMCIILPSKHHLVLENFENEGLVTNAKNPVDNIADPNQEAFNEENVEISKNIKDEFEMDPIFNEIIEPSLRINKGMKSVKL